MRGRGWMMGAVTLALFALGGGATLAGTSGAAPAPAAKTVTVFAGGTLGFRFSPAVASVPQGGSVLWHFNASGHTTTDESGLHVWDSGPGLSVTGQEFTHMFTAAGTYPYECTQHFSFGMTGTVKVPIKVAPKTGGTSTTVTITWSKAAPAAGQAFDVQVKGPGDTAFHAFQTFTHTTATHSSTLLAAGKWTFRSRLASATTTAATGYSPARSVTIS